MGYGSVYHYTSQSGYNGIIGTGVIKASDPSARGKGSIKKPTAVYVSTIKPENLQASGRRGQMGLTNDKSSHYISFEIDEDRVKRVDRQDSSKRLYIEEDINIRNSNNKLKDDVKHCKC